MISSNHTKIELLENSVLVGDLVKVMGSLHTRRAEIGNYIEKKARLARMGRTSR